MMELTNTPENKAKFFAQYFNQRILSYEGISLLLNDKWHISDENFNLAWLKLTPLSQITDEHATEVVEIVKSLGISSSAMVEPQKFLQPMKESKGTIHIVAPVVDYLRSNGYALPFMGLSVEQLVSYKWIVLKN